MSASGSVVTSTIATESAIWRPASARGRRYYGRFVMEKEIIVKGRGEARSLPDRAVLNVLVDAEGSTREQAYDDAATAAKQVDDVLAGRTAGIDRVITAALMVHPKSRWKKGESVRTGWRASRATTVEVTDLAQLGELISELTAAGGTISGPSWRLDESNPAHREARKLAAEDARRRAEDYAGTLGLLLGEVAWISEPGLRAPGQEDRFNGAIPAAARGAMAGESSDVIDVQPDEIRTVAAVEIGFSLNSLGS